MPSKAEGRRFTLREELAAYLDYGPPPIPDRIIEAVARRDDVTPGQVRDHFSVFDQLVNSIALYLGHAPEGDGDLRMLAAKFEAEFLLDPGDLDKLLATHLLVILVARQRKIANPSLGEVRDIDEAVANFAENDDMKSLEPESADLASTCYRRMIRLVNRPAMVEPTDTPSPSLADLLRKDHPRASVQIAFADFMQNKLYATFNELAFKVHGDDETSEVAIRQNVVRVNGYLEGKGLSVRFSCQSGSVVKTAAPE